MGMNVNILKNYLLPPRLSGDAIMAHLGLAEPAEPPANPIRDLARGGNKIGAIKRYREQHAGVGLKEAKEAVEAMMEGNEPPIGLPENRMP